MISQFFNIEYLKHIFLYQEESPLIFTAFYFWAFFAIILAIFSIIHKQRALRNAFLFFASLFFYYKTSGFFFFILIFSTFSDYFIGMIIHSRKKDWSQKSWVAVSVIINLFVLSYFKYAYFFTESYNNMFHTNHETFNVLAYWSNSWTGTHFDVDKILLPVGISFYTFQTISYAVDVYKKRIEPVKNILDFGFYVSFFPQLVAGPIVRASEFIPQLYKPYKLSKYQFGMAVFWILNGLIKKVVIGDYMAVNFIDRIFANPNLFSGFENLMALYGYSLQVYADFSGYTDIAIGVAALMGFTLPTNFNSPYKAKSTAEFWKRWHMSLSNWLKDYLYIPLGGNRGGSIATYLSITGICVFVIFISGWLWLTYVFLGIAILLTLLAVLFKGFRVAVSHNINLLVTMLLGGLWHGSSWMFVIWGGLNGIGLIIYKLWKKISPWDKNKSWYVVAWRIFLTFNFITFTRIWFRAENLESTWVILKQIGNDFSADLIPEVIVSYKWVFITFAIGMIIHWLPSRTKIWYRHLFIRMPVAAKVLVVVGTVFMVYQSMSSDLQAFIYFQF